MTVLEVVVDGVVVGYARDDENGRDAADKIVLDNAVENGSVQHVTRIPQGAHWLDK